MQIRGWNSKSTAKAINKANIKNGYNVKAVDRSLGATRAWVATEKFEIRSLYHTVPFTLVLNNISDSGTTSTKLGFCAS